MKRIAILTLALTLFAGALNAADNGWGIDPNGRPFTSDIGCGIDPNGCHG